jgi:hypothetical protein
MAAKTIDSDLKNKKDWSDIYKIVRGLIEEFKTELKGFAKLVTGSADLTSTNYKSKKRILAMIGLIEEGIDKIKSKLTEGATKPTLVRRSKFKEASSLLQTLLSNSQELSIALDEYERYLAVERKVFNQDIKKAHKLVLKTLRDIIDSLAALSRQN